VTPSKDLLRCALPGSDLIEKGLDDLRAGRPTREAFLVAIGRPRLTRLGFAVPKVYDRPEILLYEQLATEDPDAAHGRYNALIRRLVSFERAAECSAEAAAFAASSNPSTGDPNTLQTPPGAGRLGRG
jgi:hypothetical protein